MSIYLTLFSVGQFSFIEPIIWLLVDCPSNFSEIHIFWEIMEADFVFNGLFFSTSEKNKREKPQVITTDCCLSSSVSSLIFFNQNFETTDWVSQLDPVSSDAINRVPFKNFHITFAPLLLPSVTGPHWNFKNHPWAAAILMKILF